MCHLLGVHLLVVYLNSTQIHPGSRNVLAVTMDLLGVHLVVVYLNSTQIRTSSRNVLAVAMGLLGVWPTRCAPTIGLLEFYTHTAL